MASAALRQYKQFVRQHPSLVLNAERLLHWLAWNPERFSGSEFAYEGFNAAVGLLGIYNEHVLAEQPDAPPDAAARWALWLAAVEQAQTLVELRALQLEAAGKMSRYSPLVFLELVKVVLRLRLWRSSRSALALEAPTQEDADQHECGEQLQELLGALMRLRARYALGPDDEPAAANDAERNRWNAELATAAAVRAAAVAPCRPPAACAAATLGVRAGSLGGGGGVDAGLCPACRGDAEAKAADADEAGQKQQQQQQQRCKVCGAPLWPQQPQQQPSHAEIAPLSDRLEGGSSSNLERGWWRRITGLYRDSSGSSTAAGGDKGGGGSSSAGALPGSWAPGSRPRSPAAAAAAAAAAGPVPRPLDAPNGWVLSHRDASIGHGVVWAGEAVHLLRPLAYVLLLRRYGLRSWRPWLASLAIDLASGYGLRTGRAILERSNASRWPAPSTLHSLALLRSLSSSGWSPGEQQELLARRLQLLRYLLRSPCYEALTRRLLQRVVAGTRWAPGLSSLTEFAFNMVEGMQSYYTYVES